MEAAAANGAAIDVQQKFSAAALDVVGELAFAQSLGALDGQQSDMEHHIHHFLCIFALVYLTPWPGRRIRIFLARRSG